MTALTYRHGHIHRSRHALVAPRRAKGLLAYRGVRRAAEPATALIGVTMNKIAHLARLLAVGTGAGLLIALALAFIIVSLTTDAATGPGYVPSSSIPTPHPFPDGWTYGK